MKKYLPRYSDCFVCGKNNHSGLKRRFYVFAPSDEEISDEVYVNIAFPKEYEGFKGVVHGGVITALIDEAMGWSSTIKTALMYVTYDLNITFLKPVPVGQELTFKAWMTEDNKKVTRNEGVVMDADGDVLVKASGRFFALSEEDQKEVIDYLTFDEDTLDLFIS